MEAIMEWVMCGLTHVINFLAPAKDILIGVGGTMLLVWGGEWLRERYSRTKRAYYLVVRVTLVLDEFVGRCVSIVSDRSSIEKGEYAFGDLILGKDAYKSPPPPITPAVSEFPADVDWKSIDSELMYSILDLQNDVQLMVNNYRRIEDNIPFELEDYSSLYGMRWGLYSISGLRAVLLVSDLHEKYKISRGGLIPSDYSKQKQLFTDTLEEMGAGENWEPKWGSDLEQKIVNAKRKEEEASSSDPTTEKGGGGE